MQSRYVFTDSAAKALALATAYAVRRADTTLVPAHIAWGLLMLEGDTISNRILGLGLKVAPRLRIYTAAHLLGAHESDKEELETDNVKFVISQDESHAVTCACELNGKPLTLAVDPAITGLIVRAWTRARSGCSSHLILGSYAADRKPIGLSGYAITTACLLSAALSCDKDEALTKAFTALFADAKHANRTCDVSSREERKIAQALAGDDTMEKKLADVIFNMTLGALGGFPSEDPHKMPEEFSKAA